jgi:hypothetical protein
MTTLERVDFSRLVTDLGTRSGMGGEGVEVAHLVVDHLPGDDDVKGLLRLQLQGVRSFRSVAEQVLQGGGGGLWILKQRPRNESSAVIVKYVQTWTSSQGEWADLGGRKKGTLSLPLPRARPPRPPLQSSG